MVTIAASGIRKLPLPSVTALAAGLPSQAGDSKFGGMSGIGVDLAALAVRSFQEIARALKATALLFTLDAISPF